MYNFPTFQVVDFSPISEPRLGVLTSFETDAGRGVWDQYEILSTRNKSTAVAKSRTGVLSVFFYLHIFSSRPTAKYRRVFSKKQERNTDVSALPRVRVSNTTCLFSAANAVPLLAAVPAVTEKIRTCKTDHPAFTKFSAQTPLERVANPKGGQQGGADGRGSPPRESATTMARREQDALQGDRKNFMIVRKRATAANLQVYCDYGVDR